MVDAGSVRGPSLVWGVLTSQADPPGDEEEGGPGGGPAGAPRWPRVMTQTGSVVCNGPGVQLKKLQ